MLLLKAVDGVFVCWCASLPCDDVAQSANAWKSFHTAEAMWKKLSKCRCRWWPFRSIQRREKELYWVPLSDVHKGEKWKKLAWTHWNNGSPRLCSCFKVCGATRLGSYSEGAADGGIIWLYLPSVTVSEGRHCPPSELFYCKQATEAQGTTVVTRLRKTSR